MAGAVLLWSPGALASAGCTTTSPSIGQTIVACSVAGTESIPVPEGTQSATVVVIGGGGASGTAESTRLSGAGGNGAHVTADIDLANITNLTATVGAGGQGGSSVGGAGGGFSAVYRGLSQAAVDVLIVAGGGGGGGRGNGQASGNAGSGGHGAALDTAAGGVGESGPGNGFLPGGQGGNAGKGGEAGNDKGNPGENWNLGGAGGSAAALEGGGGSGYGGGGSGGADGNASRGAAGGGAGGSFADPTLASNVVYRTLGATSGANVAGAGAARVTDPDSSGSTRGEAGRAGSITITFFIRTNPAPSTTSSPTPTQRSMALDFTLPSDVRCNFTAVEASQGSWVQVPSASDCTISGRATESVPTLLGWATDADFPVAIAQRQVDNGWGAYETKDEAGQLTGVFIPAGGYTSVTSDTNLHPIWSD